MSGNPGFPLAPLDNPDSKQHRRQIAIAANRAVGGKLNATFDLTLAANAGSTTIIDQRIGAFSFIALMPITAHAAAELASGNLYFTGFASGAGAAGSCVVHHTNNSQTDRNFVGLIIG